MGVVPSSMDIEEYIRVRCALFRRAVGMDPEKCVQWLLVLPIQYANRLNTVRKKLFEIICRDVAKE